MFMFSKNALKQNLKTLRSIVGKRVTLAVAVKGNAYGHGLVESARAFVDAGADYLCVNALHEGQKLRKAGLKCPILTMGYVPQADLEEAVDLKQRL